MSKILDGIIKANKNLVWDKTQLTILFVGVVYFKREDNILPYKVCEIQFVPILFVGFYAFVTCLFCVYAKISHCVSNISLAKQISLCVSTISLQGEISPCLVARFDGG